MICVWSLGLCLTCCLALHVWPFAWAFLSWLDEFSVPRHPQPNAFHPLAFRESKHLASGSGSGSGAGGGGDLTGAGAALLGSGNFGVIRGGTFYPAESEEEDYRYGSGFGANGHGRPSYRANPRPHQHQDFFANFRDFAEINVPALSAYSQLYLVLAAPNRTQQVIYQLSSINK